MEWVEYLIKNPAMVKDFVEFCDKASWSKINQAELALCDEGNTMKSVALFGEKRGIDFVRNKVVQTLREKEQSDEYLRKKK